jgi:hypothetical protein
MDLNKLMVSTKSAWIEYPGKKGFSVEVANLSKVELNAMRKRNTIREFEKKLRMWTEVVDDDKFLTDFSKATIKNWKGLKLKYLETLILIDPQGADLESELPYSQENAELLLNNSVEFDNWLNEVVFDLNNFRSGTAGGSV